MSSESPYSSIRIADFSRVLVGPFFTRILGTMGAEVVRLEWRKRPDQFRRFEPYVGGKSVNNSGIYHGLNYSKLSCEIDITTESGKEAAFDLIKHADVVVENFRPGQFARMGFSREKVFQLNPAIIFISLSGLGQNGPDSSYVAYGNTLHGYSGFVDITGYPGEEGRGISGAWGDPVSSLFAGIAVLAAIEERLRTGQRRGHYIDLSMVESLLTTLPEPLVAAQIQPDMPRTSGNRSQRFVPQGVLPSRGSDRWVAFSIQTYAQFRQLISLSQLTGYDDPALFSVSARRRLEDRLLAELSQWSVSFEPYELSSALRAAGIPAGVVSDTADIATHEDFNRRGLMQSIDVGATERMTLMGIPWTTTRPDLLTFGPPPKLGEHTEGILRDVLGYPCERISRLQSELTAV